MIEDDLPALLRASAPEPPAAPVDRIVAAGRRRGRLRWLVAVAGTGLAVVAVVLLVATFLRPVAPAVSTATTCAAPVPSGVLPDWARAGFSAPEPVVPYVLGAGGEIVAIPFAELTQPPAPGRGNKILWVVRDEPGAALTIIAGRGVETVVQTLPGGAGPSTVDVPEPGCWTFDLRWGAHRDTLVLPYVNGPPA